MPENEIYHIAVMPSAEIPAGLLRRVAAVVAQPDYQIRMLLAGRVPKIIGHFKDEAAAKMAIHSLKELKLVAFVISESELRRPITPGLVARSTKIEGDSAIFTNREGKTEAVKLADVFLVLTGRWTRITGEATVETSKMKVNVPATLLTGGIPVMKRVTTKAAEPTKITEQFIRLYRKESDIPTVEIRQFDFDYSFLGEKKGPTATGNIAAAVMAFRHFFDKANFNDSLLSGFVSEAKSISGIDLGEQNCGLLVRYYRALANNDQ